MPPKSGGVEFTLTGVLWVPAVVADEVEDADDMDEDEFERGNNVFLLRSALLTSSWLGEPP